MEKMLITGGNGFLGYHLSQKSISEGIDVTVLDDLSTSTVVKFSGEARFIREKVEESKIDDKFDYIVHLAARPSPDDYVLNPVETLLSNSIGTLRMLELARKYNSRFFLHLLIRSIRRCQGNTDTRDLLWIRQPQWN